VYRMFPFLNTLFANPISRTETCHCVRKVLPHLDIVIVKRSDIAIGFKAAPKQWIVERTIVAQTLPKTWQGLGKSRRGTRHFLRRDT
jgi:hypothetical protein